MEITDQESARQKEIDCFVEVLREYLPMEALDDQVIASVQSEMEKALGEQLFQTAPEECKAALASILLHTLKSIRERVSSLDLNKASVDVEVDTDDPTLMHCHCSIPLCGPIVEAPEA